MDSYLIMLIEDDETEKRMIRSTIKDWFQENRIGNLDFYDFDINQYTSLDEVIKKVFIDLDDGIDCIIVDYKLITKKARFDGNKIYDSLISAAPQYPCIILTNNVNECKSTNEVDLDKIYVKRVFLDTDEGKEKSDSLVNNIFANIDLHRSKISALESAINQAISEPGLPFAKMLECEEQISRLIPNYREDSIFDSVDEKYKLFIEIIKEMKKIVDDKI